jgi:hypothetical protein
VLPLPRTGHVWRGQTNPEQGTCVCMRVCVRGLSSNKCHTRTRFYGVRFLDNLKGCSLVLERATTHATHTHTHTHNTHIFLRFCPITRTLDSIDILYPTHHIHTHVLTRAQTHKHTSHTHAHTHHISPSLLSTRAHTSFSLSLTRTHTRTRTLTTYFSFPSLSLTHR